LEKSRIEVSWPHQMVSLILIAIMKDDIFESILVQQQCLGISLVGSTTLYECHGYIFSEKGTVTFLLSSMILILKDLLS